MLWRVPENPLSDYPIGYFRGSIGEFWADRSRLNGVKRTGPLNLGAFIGLPTRGFLTLFQITGPRKGD